MGKLENSVDLWHTRIHASASAPGVLSDLSLTRPESDPRMEHLMSPVRATTGAARSAALLNPIDLLEYTRFAGEEILAGRYPFVRFDPDERWHQRLYRDRRDDLWLISWLPGQGTQLHDHGGSSGAFTVLSGELSEATYRPHTRSQSEQVHLAGTGFGFGAHYIHDVRNVTDRPAVSVHAYSLPLERMNFYDLNESGELELVATAVTDDPEPAPELIREVGIGAA